MPLQKIRLVAYQLGEKIHLKNFKAAYEGTIYSSSSTEVFIKKEDSSYIYVQNSGEIAFSDCDENTINEFIDLVMRFVDAPVLQGKEYKENCHVKCESIGITGLFYSFVSRLFK